MSDDANIPSDEVKPQPIPEILHSFYEDRPFKTCTRCGESLAEFEEGYRLSKVIKNDEVIFEYALCFECLKAMMDESSDESKQALDKYTREHYREVSGFNDCNFCENTQETCKGNEFSVVGICQGEHMLDSGMVCVDCMEAMAEVVSDETRGVWDKFKEENFPGVPADFQPAPVKDSPVMI